MLRIYVSICYKSIFIKLVISFIVFYWAEIVFKFWSRHPLRRNVELLFFKFLGKFTFPLPLCRHTVLIIFSHLSFFNQSIFIFVRFRFILILWNICFNWHHLLFLFDIVILCEVFIFCLLLLCIKIL